MFQLLGHRDFGPLWHSVAACLLMPGFQTFISSSAELELGSWWWMCGSFFFLKEADHPLKTPPGEPGRDFPNSQFAPQLSEVQGHGTPLLLCPFQVAGRESSLCHLPRPLPTAHTPGSPSCHPLEFCGGGRSVRVLGVQEFGSNK